MVEIRYETAFKLYPYEKVAGQTSAPVRHPVVIVGGGPIGLALALDLGNKGTPALVLDDHEGAGLGSKAICFAKRPLEIMNRLGCGHPMVEKGVKWDVGKVFFDERQVYEFNLLPEDGHEFPAFINLQQYYFEEYMVRRVRELEAEGAPIDLRGGNKVLSVKDKGDHTSLIVDTPDGEYTLEADWVIACDGAGSPIRSMMGLDFIGRVFEDNFLIADGKGVGEGVVIKNYSWSNKYGRQTWAKIVTSEFKAKHQKVMGGTKVQGASMVEEAISSEFVTEALVSKTLGKITSEGGWTSKKIPELLNRVYYDVVREDCWEFVKKHKDPTINFKTLKHFVFRKVKELSPQLF